ncbi:hypothetical protein MML48_3g00008977 [Holotrichia oblita]|uniref:Uncharacterized protein n=1 Tax=Holotrichia oblita TaxID=644536 RepID=A0ACB9TBI0_HOLOL|nr:hypothetical protein MML48_3g00008977 [Holotrichia oblita]
MKEKKGDENRSNKVTFEEVDKFKYLGVMLSSDGNRDVEIKEKILAANRAFYAKKKTNSNVFSGNDDEENLRVFERKILRSIMGPIKEADNEFRIRTNEELQRELKGKDIVQEINQQRIKWFGYVWRSGEESVIKLLVEWKPGGKKRRGRPRSKWLEEVVEDVRGAGVSNWQEKTKDRKRWKEISHKV